MPNSKNLDEKRPSRRPKTPLPNAKKFSSTYQPSPEAKSKGLQERNARLMIQRELEKTLEEMLNDPMTDTLALTNFIKSMPKEKTIVQAITGLLIKDMAKPDTSGRDRMKLLETLIKAGYGDKLDVTSNGKDIQATPMVVDFGGTNVKSDAETE